MEPVREKPRRADRKVIFRRRLLEHYLSTQVKLPSDDLQAGIRSRRPYVHRLIRNHFPASLSARILDLGCGYGGLLSILGSLGYSNTHGVDASPEQVAAAHSLGLESVQQGDVLDVIREQEPNSHDVVLAFDVLEHFDREDALEIADEARRALRPGGRLIVHVPNGEGILGGGVAFGDITHETVFTRRSLEQLLRVAGFAQVALEEDTPAVHGLASGARWVAWQAIRSVVRLAYVAQTGDFSSGLIVSQNFLAVACK